MTGISKHLLAPPPPFATWTVPGAFSLFCLLPYTSVCHVVYYRSLLIVLPASIPLFPLESVLNTAARGILVKN